MNDSNDIRDEREELEILCYCKVLALVMFESGLELL